ncbi:hypothetical protein HNQ50_002465 [Silvimonas terrae]|uniref:Uncharacterized protein n=1 Tax=Silvimonas terrae TaxID=300266 RepID=A0A840REH8_9NEIS|nr:hypothetical protein [Silvimonas terrae]MBB5191735.1 hypothetical protein [Silvimonas terrae]
MNNLTLLAMAMAAAPQEIRREVRMKKLRRSACGNAYKQHLQIVGYSSQPHARTRVSPSNKILFFPT